MLAASKLSTSARSRAYFKDWRVEMTTIDRSHERKAEKSGKEVRRELLNCLKELKDGIDRVRALDPEFESVLPEILEDVTRPISLRQVSRGGTGGPGNLGERIYDETHNDIDQRTINISCKKGSADVYLEERIWTKWSLRNKWSLEERQYMDVVVNVDSDWFDGDHHLYVIATSNETTCEFSFTSKDN